GPLVSSTFLSHCYFIFTRCLIVPCFMQPEADDTNSFDLESLGKSNTLTYKTQFFFTLKDDQLFCRLLVNKKKSPKYCMQCPYSISSNDPKLMISTINHLRNSHGLRAPDVQSNEYVQIIDNM